MTCAYADNTRTDAAARNRAAVFTLAVGRVGPPTRRHDPRSAKASTPAKAPADRSADRRGGDAVNPRERRVASSCGWRLGQGIIKGPLRMNNRVLCRPRRSASPSRRGTEVVVTGAPRKRVVRKGTWVRIPPSPPK